jgi:membrane protein DedA with SNARE-associated domain
VVVRRLLFFIASFHLGRALGPWAIPWIEARAARFARLVRWVERLFLRAPRVVVLVMAGPTVSALAGVSWMRFGVFAPLAATSLLIRALLFLGFAAWLDDDIAIALSWLDRYWIPATVVMVSGVAYYEWQRRRRAESGRLSSLKDPAAAVE